MDTGITKEIAKKCVRPGWYRLLDELYDKLPSNVCVHQVKEKFGGLRFYVGPASSALLDFIDEKEKESLTICEVCGDKGEMYVKRGWFKTLCQKCAKEQEFVLFKERPPFASVKIRYQSEIPQNKDKED